MKTVEEKKVYGYCRVSTGDQAGSLEAQRAEIEKYCMLNNIGTPEFLIDENVSGTTEMGARLNGRILCTAPKGTVIVTTKLDRMFRSCLDSLNNIDRWIENKVVLHIIDFFHGPLNTENPLQMAMLQMSSVFADLERSMISARTKSVLANMRKQNKRTTRFPPFGWRYNDEGIRYEVPEQQEVIKNIKIMHEAGYNFSDICREMISQNVPTASGGKWTPLQIQRIVERKE